jgi:TetR/AcrR family transcriptional repressor of uid operon
MAEISQAAGVSVANLYQYFTTKDALVHALVEDDLAQDLAIIGGIARAPSFRDGVRAAIAESLLQLRDPSYCRLRLELLAEATRNPAIGAVVQEADERMIAALAEILEHARGAGELRFTTSARSAAIMALSLFDGLAGRPLPEDEASMLAADCEGFLMAALGAPPAG